jgi:hypothetical protein
LAEINCRYMTYLKLDGKSGHPMGGPTGGAIPGWRRTTVVGKTLQRNTDQTPARTTPDQAANRPAGSDP